MKKEECQKIVDLADPGEDIPYYAFIPCAMPITKDIMEWAERVAKNRQNDMGI